MRNLVRYPRHDRITPTASAFSFAAVNFALSAPSARYTIINALYV